MFAAKLQRRLDNDEPKCANCGHWAQDCNHPSIGVCGLLRQALHEQGVEIGTDVRANSFAIRTDLTVCSRWEQKPDRPE